LSDTDVISLNSELGGSKISLHARSYTTERPTERHRVAPMFHRDIQKRHSVDDHYLLMNRLVQMEHERPFTLHGDWNPTYVYIWSK
jgi:hypothetical protein